jgi:hypothetical protein
MRLVQTHAFKALLLATRSTQILGVASTLFGLVMIIEFGVLNRYERFRPHFIAMGTIVWFGPGVMFLAASYFLSHRRKIGALTAMGVALVQSICAAAILVAFCTLPPITPIPILLCVLWIAALGQMMVHLQRSLRAIDVDVENRPGFAVDGPKRVLTVEETEMRHV